MCEESSARKRENPRLLISTTGRDALNVLINKIKHCSWFLLIVQ